LLKKFECIEGCSDCCINRGYFPSKEFGKIGVILVPGERKKIERLAEIKKIDIKILPRIGVSRNDGGEGPERIIAYQLMGRERDGNICPFLETDGSKKSPHGGALCSIYDERPAACKAYPLVTIDPTISTLDSKCSYCVTNNGNKVCNLGLNDEITALNEIIASTEADEDNQLWRYATNVGDSSGGKMLPEGWKQIKIA
jgi:Fe-S-cluster containining protein